MGDEKLNVLEKVLNKPVEISFVNQKLHIKVFKENLSDKIPYFYQITNGWTVPIGYTYEKTILHNFLSEIRKKKLKQLCEKYSIKYRIY